MRVFSKIYWYTFLAVIIYYGHLLLAPVATYFLFYYFSDGQINWWLVLLVFLTIASISVVSYPFWLVRWRTLAYRSVPESEWEKLRNHQFNVGLDDSRDRLGLIQKFSRSKDLLITSEINDHLKDNLEIERINYSFQQGKVKHFFVASSRLLPIAIAKIWLISFGVCGAVLLEENSGKFLALMYAVVAAVVYPNYAHWRHMFHKGVGFEINDQCFGSVYPYRQIIYWKDVDRFYIHKRGWRKFLVVELTIGITYHFDISLYGIGDVNYFGEMMRLYWDRHE